MSLEETRTPNLRLWHHVTGDNLQVHHLNVQPASPLDGEADLRTLYSELFSAMADRGITPLREVIFAEEAIRGDLTEARAAALTNDGEEADRPWTMVGCTPCAGGGVAGVQIFGVGGQALKGGSCETVVIKPGQVGRLLDAGGQRLAVLHGVNGLTPGEEPGGGAEQAGHMFRRAGGMATDLGFSFRETARSWIYIPRLLDWYAEFNQARNEAFRQMGLIAADGRRRWLPASTGIQGVPANGAACAMDLLLASSERHGRTTLSPMSSGHQNEASEYGSSFARGMRLNLGQADLLLVSGTASIGQDGQTLHQGDPAAQIKETLAAVRAVLRPASARVRDLVAGVAFFKNMDAYRAWQQHQRDNPGTADAAIVVLADICRDDLLFELETTAAVETA